MRARVILVVFDGFQSLDAFGPAEVFTAANRLLPSPGYRVVLASTAGGARRTGSGMRIKTRRLLGLQANGADTVLVAGGDNEPVARAARDRALLGWLHETRAIAGRFGSVCTGAFVLGAIGALDGKRCATHWSACDGLAGAFPRAHVQREAIFSIDGNLWTSAGVTAGIDMSLAMVEADHGARIADDIAAQAVLYARRPGFQSQFSDALVAQVAASDPLGPSIAWGRRHLSELSVETLARRAGLAVRTLHRRTQAVLGVTPAKLIEKIRVEHARMLLSSTELSQKQVADQSGFSGNAQMQRALQRHLGVGGAARLLFAKVRALSSSGTMPPLSR